jgi:hypothetical protein
MPLVSPAECIASRRCVAGASEDGTPNAAIFKPAAPRPARRRAARDSVHAAAPERFTRDTAHGAGGRRSRRYGRSMHRGSPADGFRRIANRHDARAGNG